MEDIDIIKGKIHFIRGEQVMLDRDLAELFGVETKNLKRQVRRNMIRFPEDFMFELTHEDYSSLRVTNKRLLVTLLLFLFPVPPEDVRFKDS